MAFGRLWAGQIFGTNTGNVFVKLEGEDANLTGLARIADHAAGIVIYDLKATFDGTRLKAGGTPRGTPEGVLVGALSVSGNLNSKGEVRGEWETTIGTGGTFVLYPHDSALPGPAGDGPAGASEADQLHTKRHTLGAVEIDKEQLLKIADKVAAEFPGRQVVVTVAAATEQARYLEEFRNLEPAYPQADLVRIWASQPEPGGVNRNVTVELGPSVNFIQAQSSDEAWTLGMVEKLKRYVHPYERQYPTNFRRWGFGVSQILVIWAVVFMPEIANLFWRIGFFAGVLLIVFAGNRVQRYLPNATILLAPRRPSVWTKLGPSFLSWLVAAATAFAVTLLSAAAKFWLQLS